MGTLVVPLGYATATEAVSNSVVKTLDDLGFSATQVAAADEMRLTAYDSDASYTYDGTTPTTGGIGHYIALEENVLIRGNDNIRNFKIIGITGTCNIFVTLNSYRPVVA